MNNNLNFESNSFNLGFTIEEKTYFDHIKHSDKPVVLYGKGNGAIKIINALKEHNIKVDAIFSSTDFYRGSSYFEGIPIFNYAQLIEKYGDFTILLAFGVFTDDMVAHMEDYAKKHTFFAPDIPLFSSGILSHKYLYENKENIKKAYNLLADEQSKVVFKDIINFKLTGDIFLLKKCTTSREEVFQNIFEFDKVSGSEVYCDLGAYNGDTIEEFLNIVEGKYKKIYALEPDPKNFSKLQKNISAYEHKEKIQIHQKASWSTDTQLSFSAVSSRSSSLDDNGNILTDAISVDSLLRDDYCSYIKMDVEGAEYETLIGASNTIKKFSPKLAVSAYHKLGDMFKLPLLINQINPDYKIYMRHHQYIPAWETNIYATI